MEEWVSGEGSGLGLSCVVIPKPLGLRGGRGVARTGGARGPGGSVGNAHVQQVGEGRMAEAGASDGGVDSGGENVLAEELVSGGLRRLRTKIRPQV